MKAKRALAIIVATVVLAGLAGGLGALAAGLESQEQAIDLRPGETYEIALDSNPSTGYGWQAAFDEKLLTLVEQRFEQDSSVDALVGVGGKEVFVFRGVAAGTTNVVFSYQRPWEDEALKTQSYTFNVVP